MQLSVNLFGVIWVAVLLSYSLCQNNCQVQDGKPGQTGIPGRDGWPGQKGEKGEPGLQVELSKEALIALKGDKGEDGPVGNIGAKGFSGVLGPPGPMGPQGNPGSSVGSGSSSSKKAAFTVVRKSNQFPRFGSALTFTEELTNLNEDFNRNTGYFTSKVAGVYYFAFHAVTEGDLCLKLRSNNKQSLSLLFCDFLRTAGISQVMSGGAVVELAVGNRVWLEPFKVSGRRGESNKISKTEMSVFNGFLIFASG